MRRKLKQFYKNYREVLVGGFIVLGVLVAILGTYQVYAPSFSDRPLKLFTVVLYDTIRLLLFSFRISITEPTPLLYEIAVWLAPFTMLVTIFAVLRRTSQKVRLFAKYLFRGGYLVLGVNQQALELLQTHQELDHSLKAVCIGTDKNDPVLSDEMGKRNLLCLHSSLDELETVKFLSRRRLKRYERIIVLEPEPQMYALLYTLNTLVYNAGIDRLKVYAAYRNPLFYEHMTDHANHLEHLSIEYVNFDALAIHNLFSHPRFSMLAGKHALLQVPETREKLSQAIGSAHVLLLGFGTLGTEFIRWFANNGTINLDFKNRVSVVSPSFTSQEDAFLLNHSQVRLALEIHGHQGRLNSQSTQTWLQALCLEEPITHVVFTEDAFEENMEFLLRNKALFADCVVCFYTPQAEHKAVLDDVFKECFTAFLTYGDAMGIYHPDIIFRDRIMQMAKSYNLRYEIAKHRFVQPDTDETSPSGIASTPALDQEELWLHMSEHKRISSAAMAMHKRTKQELIQLLCPDCLANDGARARRCELLLETLPDDEKITTLLEDTLLNYLAGIEHLRWCHFHYMRNWTFGVRDDANRVHDYLIPDWDTFVADEARRCTIIYDFLPYVMEMQDKT